MNELEIWKAIPGFQDIYQVSNLGNIRSIDHVPIRKDGRKILKKGTVLKQQTSIKGYKQVSLMIYPTKKYNTGVHRLVALTFIDNVNDLPQVNHINGVKSDNRVENLEWVTNRENQLHAIRNGLTNTNSGEKHHNSKLTNNQVLEIRQRHINGEKIINLSKEFKITPTALVNITKNRTYINI